MNRFTPGQLVRYNPPSILRSDVPSTYYYVYIKSYDSSTDEYVIYHKGHPSTFGKIRVNSWLLSELTEDDKVTLL